MLGLLVGLVASAPVAGAHHPNIAAKSSCANGTYTISWTATSWTTVSDPDGRHADIEISYKIGSSPEWISAGEGEFTQANGGSFSGSFTVPGTTSGTVQVKAYANGPWGNRQAGGQSDITSVSLAGTCIPPANPSATATVDCAEDEIVLALTGQHRATTVTIRKNGNIVDSNVPVPVGSSTRTVDLAPGDENTTVTIALDYAVGTDQTLQVPVDCDGPPAPSAQVTWTCGADASVVLGNAGGEPTTATIRKNGAVVTTVVLAPGATNVVRTVPMGAGDEDTTVTILVTFDDAGTATDVTKAYEVNCQQADPQVGDVECATGGLRIALANTGSQGTTFTVTSPALPGGSTTVPVGAGGSSNVLIPLAEDATTSVTITAGGEPLFSDQSLTRDCQKPDVTLRFDCAEGGIVVALTNSGSEAADVAVGGQTVTVPAGGSKTVVVTVAEGAAYSLSVLGESISGTRDCEQPGATLVFDCAEGGVVVTLTNTGALATTVVVAGQSHVVGPQGSKTVVVPVAEGASYDVSVTGDGLSKSLSGTRDCEEPGIGSVVFDCVAGGVVITLENPGELPTTVTVAGHPWVVPAGGTLAVTVPVAENADYAVAVVGDGLEETSAAPGTASSRAPRWCSTARRAGSW